MNKTNKHLVIAAMALMLSVALLSGLGHTAQAAPDAPTAQTWYCDPGDENKGIQFTLDNLAHAGDTICLWPSATSTGSAVYFNENVVVNYTVTILGLNHGLVAWEPRGPESYVYSAEDGAESVFDIRADNVTIDGVFIGAAGGHGHVMVDAADHGVNATYDNDNGDFTYLSDVKVLNCFVESAVESGISFVGDKSSFSEYSDGNVISGNYVLRYTNPGATQTGIAVSYNMFTEISNNHVRNYEDGINVSYFSLEGAFEVEDNLVFTTASASFGLNSGITIYMIVNAEDITIDVDSNVVYAAPALDAPGAPSGADAYVGYGIVVAEVYGVFGVDDTLHITISHNILYQLDIGMLFFNLALDADEPVILHGNVLYNIDDYGVAMFSSFNTLYPYGGAPHFDWVGVVAFDVSDMLITGVAGDAFLVQSQYYYQSVWAPLYGKIYVDMSSGVVINDAHKGFSIIGQGSNVTSSAPAGSNQMNAFSTGDFYFDLWHNMWNIDATRIAIEGKVGSAMNCSEMFTVENRTGHAVDNPVLGFVMYVEGTAYVAWGVDAEIQNAIDLSLVHPTQSSIFKVHYVYVQWGIYYENLNITRAIEVRGVTSMWASTEGHEANISAAHTSLGATGLVEIYGATNVIFANFTLYGDFEDAAVIIRNAYYITIDEVEIYDFGEDGIWVDSPFGSVHDILVSNCYFEDVDWAVYFEADAGSIHDVIVIGCFFEEVDDDAIVFDATGAPIYEVDVICNVFEDVEGDAVWLMAYVGEWDDYSNNILVSYHIFIAGNELDEGAINITGIADSVIEHNFWDWEHNSDFHMLNITVIDGDEVFIVDNMFMSDDKDADAINIETDLAERYIWTGADFEPRTPYITNNSFYDVDGVAISYYEGELADSYVEPVHAASNYWGDMFGPFSWPGHEFNPNENGEGAAVEDYVDFAPWWEAQDWEWTFEEEWSPCAWEQEFASLTANVFHDLNKDRYYQYGEQVYYTIQKGVDAWEGATNDHIVVMAVHGQYSEWINIDESLHLYGQYRSDGMTVYNPSLTSPNVFVNYAVINVTEAGPVYIDLFWFVHFGYLAIYADDGSDVEITHNTFNGDAYNDGAIIIANSVAAIAFNAFNDIGKGNQYSVVDAIYLFQANGTEIWFNMFQNFAGLEGKAPGAAIWSRGSSDLAIDGNFIYNVTTGIYVSCRADMVLPGLFVSGIEVEGNFLWNVTYGICTSRVDDVMIVGNTIFADGPYQNAPAPGIGDLTLAEDVRIRESTDVTLTGNNLLAVHMDELDEVVGLMSIENSEWVMADENFWGKLNGPSGAFLATMGIDLYDPMSLLYADANSGAWGSGTIASANVTYETWLTGVDDKIVSAEWDAPIVVGTVKLPYVGENSGVMITDVEFNDLYGEDTALVALASYSGNPARNFYGWNLQVYFEVNIYEENTTLDSMTIRYYLPDDSDLMNLDELGLYFWDSTFGEGDGAWVPCAFSINVDGAYIEMTFDDNSNPSLNDIRSDMAFMIGAPMLVLTPSEGKSGIEVSFVAGGFIPGDLLVLYLDNNPMFTPADLAGYMIDDHVLIPTQGAYVADEFGNVTGGQILLPYLNKGEYTIRLTDGNWWVASVHEDMPSEYAAYDVYTVLGNSPLELSLQVGALYFTGELVNWVASVSEEGTPYAITADMVSAYLVYAPDGSKMPIPSEAISMIDEYTFVISGAIESTDGPGEYYLQLYVENEMYQGAAGEAFLISQTFGDAMYALVGIYEGVMTIEGQMHTLQLSVDDVILKVEEIQGSLVIMRIQIGAGFMQVQSSLDELSAQIIGIEGNIATLSTTVGDIQVNVAQIDANVSVANDGILTLITNVGKLQISLDDIGAYVFDINDNVVTLMSDVGMIQTTLDSIDANITAINGKVVTLTTKVGDVQTTVDAINLKVIAIDGRTVSMTSTLGNITGTLTSMTGTLATVNTNLGTVKTDVGNIASATTGINSTLAFIILAILIIVAIVLVFLRTKK